jgi:hypothetical protein
MYDEYKNFINSQNLELNFKSNSLYTAILEHVSVEQGTDYIFRINKIITEDFPLITFEIVNNYLLLNDKYGEPIKHHFMFNSNNIHCSPTSLRYVLHSLLILKHIKCKNMKKIVEVGCGYGGLFLAIQYFSKFLNIEIDNYYFIDLPEVINLINKYLSLHDININYSTHSSYDYGKDIEDINLFFISNYCFTEINEEYRKNYIQYLFPKVSNGFIIWQTCFNVPIQQVNILGKNILNIEEEYPQTAFPEYKNYFVYF